MKDKVAHNIVVSSIHCFNIKPTSTLTLSSPLLIYQSLKHAPKKAPKNLHYIAFYRSYLSDATEVIV